MTLLVWDHLSWILELKKKMVIWRKNGVQSTTETYINLCNTESCNNEVYVFVAKIYPTCSMPILASWRESSGVHRHEHACYSLRYWCICFTPQESFSSVHVRPRHASILINPKNVNMMLFGSGLWPIRCIKTFSTVLCQLLLFVFW